MSAALPVCPWCGQAAALIRVHGHAQCARCGVNAEPCCQGAETCPVVLETGAADGGRPRGVDDEPAHGS